MLRCTVLFARVPSLHGDGPASRMVLPQMLAVFHHCPGSNPETSHYLNWVVTYFSLNLPQGLQYTKSNIQIHYYIINLFTNNNNNDSKTKKKMDFLSNAANHKPSFMYC